MRVTVSVSLTMTVNSEDYLDVIEGMDELTAIEELKMIAYEDFVERVNDGYYADAVEFTVTTN